MAITINDTPDLNIIINQGEHLAADLVYTDKNGVAIDLTGYSATLKVRETLESETVLLTLTTANSKIAINAAAGKITIIISATDSAALPIGRLVYDLLLINPSLQPDRFTKGVMIVGKMVSRA
jgi:tRNA threonylcarbamoyladenosine modification (KEOPS) complex  Pcc1 subunit